MLNVDLIVEKMEDLELSQLDLARIMGLSQHTVWRLIHTGSATEKTLERLKEALDLTEDDLYEDEQDDTDEEIDYQRYRKPTEELDLEERVERLERIVADLMGMRRMYRKS